MPPADTRRVRLHLHTLRRSSRTVCACTFYLVFKEPDFTTLPTSYISFGGTHLSYGCDPVLSSPLSPLRRFFIDAPTVAGFSHAPTLTIADELGRALQCDLGVLRAEGSVVRLCAHRALSERRVTLGPTTICPDSGSVNRSNRLAFQLGRPRCRASFVRDRLMTIQAARGGVN